jgi:predicted transcriptional regulator of viral defense system
MRITKEKLKNHVTLDRRDLRRRLYALAARQSGYFTAAQARRIGYSYQAQKYHVDASNWLRVDRALFRLPEVPSGEHDDLVRWSLWSGDRAVVSHDSALALHELGDVNPAHIHLTVPESFGQKADRHVVLHRAELSDADIVEFEGFRATSPLRTIFDVAVDDTPQEVIDKVVDDALRQGVATRGQLLRRADEFGAVAALAIERAIDTVGES